MVTISRSIFPLCSFTVTINGDVYKLKPGEIISLNESIGAKTVMSVSCPCVLQNIQLKSDVTEIKIRSILSDYYYIIGMTVVITLFALCNFISSFRLFFNIAIIAFLIPIMFVALFRRKHYFNVRVK